MRAVDVALVVVRLGLGVWLLWSLPVVRRRIGVDLADVTVVIPARNEVANIAAAVDSVPAGVAVVVVDDHSTDGTATAAAKHGATVVTAPPLPAGWTGKTWACHAGLDRVRTGTVCFVDADVRLADGGLGGVIDALADHGGLVSVQPYHRVVRPVEHLAALFNVVAVAATDVASPRRSRHAAFGPVLATRVADLRVVGGFEAVRTEVVEDVALADRYRAAGAAVTVLGGGDAVAFRMYPDGLRSLVEGFTKNLVGGALRVRRSTVALVVAWMTLLVQSSAGLVRAAAGVSDWVPAVAVYGVTSAMVWWMARKVGRFGPVTALAHPVLVVVFLGVFANAMVARARGRVAWKGRSIPTRLDRSD